MYWSKQYFFIFHITRFVHLADKYLTINHTIPYSNLCFLCDYTIYGSESSVCYHIWYNHRVTTINHTIADGIMHMFIWTCPYSNLCSLLVNIMEVKICGFSGISSIFMTVIFRYFMVKKYPLCILLQIIVITAIFSTLILNCNRRKQSRHYIHE